MKTKEFIEKVEELGFSVSVKNGFLDVISKDYNNILQVCSKVRGRLDTYWSGFTKLNDWNIQSKLLSLAVELAYTPIEEREEPEKYYLKLPNADAEIFAYLNLSDDKKYFFASSSDSIAFQTQFTQKEIDNLPNKEFIQTLIKEEV